MLPLPELIKLMGKQESQEFMARHMNADVSRLMLKYSNDPPALALLQQIAARQKVKKKLPEWCQEPQVLFPPTVHLEQASSQITARCKAELVSGRRFTDLTGGLGVDAYYLSAKFDQSIYNEPQEHLRICAKHNFKILKRTISVRGLTAEELLPKLEIQDVIYLDPSRRNSMSRKVFLLEHCQPRITELRDLLLQKSRAILVKVSPMLDLIEAQRLLPGLAEIWIIAVKNEVKEVVLYLSHEMIENPIIQTFNYHSEKLCQKFSVPLHYSVKPHYSTPLRYIYEPNAAIMKSGGMNALSEKFPMYKLAPHSHLYTADDLLKDFPGKVFHLEEIHKPGSKLLQKQNFNIMVRNFPQKASEIAKQLKIKPAQNRFLIATTLKDNRKVILQTQWLPSLSI